MSRTWKLILPTALAVMATGACSGEPPVQVSMSSPDSQACKAMLALPENKGCNVVAGFTGGMRVGERSRLDLTQQWLAAHPDQIRSVRPSPGPDSPAVMKVLCVATSSPAATEATFQAIKGFGSTVASGAVLLCTDRGDFFQATDPVDHGGDEVRH